MTIFNKGDRVVRTTGKFLDVVEGGEYTVNRQRGNSLCLEGHEGSYSSEKFALSGHVRPAPIKPEGAYNPHNAGAPLPGYAPNIGHSKDGGGLQQHSIGGPFPFVLVGIDNPTGLEPGLYWYVQDKAGDRCTIHIKDCERAGKVAAYLSTTYPGGICSHTTPDLSLSEGYINPLVQLTLTREAAEVVSLLAAHCAGNAELTTDILRVVAGALGHGYQDSKDRFEVSFNGYGAVREAGWHAGRHRIGSIAITRKGA